MDDFNGIDPPALIYEDADVSIAGASITKEFGNWRPVDIVKTIIGADFNQYTDPRLSHRTWLSRSRSVGAPLRAFSVHCSRP